MRQYGIDLFNGERWFDHSNKMLKKAYDEIDKIPSKIFEANTLEEIRRHYYDKNSISKISLRLSEKTQEVFETEVERYDFVAKDFGDDPYCKIPGLALLVHIPYDGDMELFHIQPTSFVMEPCRGTLTDKDLSIRIEFAQCEVDEDGAKIKDRVEDEIKGINSMIASLDRDIDDFNSSLRDKINARIDSRINVVNKIKNIKLSLKIPLAESANPSPINKVSISIKELSPLAKKTQNNNEAYISSDDYERILSVIRNFGTSLESSTATNSKDEEAIRDMFLAGLQASIDVGIASGETFSVKGKTDINIPFHNKSVFIAECKNWRGKRYINSGISQLLSYATWRDVKLSYLIFNKIAKSFKSIQEQMPKIFEARSDFVRSIEYTAGEWRFELLHPIDQDRHMTVHVFMFNFYEDRSK